MMQTGQELAKEYLQQTKTLEDAKRDEERAQNAINRAGERIRALAADLANRHKGECFVSVDGVNSAYLVDVAQDGKVTIRKPNVVEARR